MAQQSTAVQGPMRLFFGAVVAQGALAAGAEVAVTVPFFFPLPRPLTIGTPGGFIFGAMILPQAAEANVQYVAEIINIQSTTQVTVRVKNVGSAAGAQTWTVQVFVFDQTDAIQ